MTTLNKITATIVTLDSSTNPNFSGVNLITSKERAAAIRLVSKHTDNGQDATALLQKPTVFKFNESAINGGAGSGFIIAGDGDTKAIILNVEDETIDAFDVFGKYYGFPACCIHDFIHRNDTSEDMERTMAELPIRKLDGTGYIPCPKCNELSEEELIANIAKNRHHSAPFPDDEFNFIDFYLFIAEGYQKAVA